jgi:hypothetical protein
VCDQFFSNFKLLIIYARMSFEFWVLFVFSPPPE